MGAVVEPFGQTADGREVRRITLKAAGLTASVLTWGAVLQDARLAGVAHGLTLGSDRLADYLADMRHHGALVAPVANRLTNAQAVIDGKTCHFEANQNGQHCLHSGAVGSHLALWQLIEAGPDYAVLAFRMPDGAGGFPGNRRMTAQFTVLPPATLRLEITAETDAPTIFNATNHSYWNLDGSATMAGHVLQIAADSYLPTTGDFIPTGEIVAVDGTPYDFRTPRRLQPQQPPLDNCFCLGGAQVALRQVMSLQGASGVRLTLATTEPGVQIYDGRNALRPGRGPYEGIAIEAQGWPDAPNKPGFPPIDLAPGKPLSQITEWRFQVP